MPLAHAHRFSWRTLLVPIFAGSLLAFGLAAFPIASGTALAANIAICNDGSPPVIVPSEAMCSGQCRSHGGVQSCAEGDAAAVAAVVRTRSSGGDVAAAASAGTAASGHAIGTADPDMCSADDTPLGQVKCYFLILIAEILLIVASFLGKILVFLTDILIGFASYNGFATTIVVERGWMIVRDIVNMFFIIVLLVSAFSSIIGYEASFHYKQVLPKLLLMAILINFSKTLILLLVDFSQVMMLTFVNAFAQAGPGNLVSALKIDKVLQMAPPGGGRTVQSLGTAAGTIDPVNIILALMLGVFMLSIALGVVVIMVGYLIFRIVGLWVALILSPIALFATALPGKMQKAVDPFTSKYWTRLTALLTGGPVMAFFLWLTFAITASSTGGDGGLAPALNFHFSNPNLPTFLTSVGTTQDVASFIVGVAMLLMGLDAAVSSAGAISETLGGWSKKVSGYSQALGKMAATSPFLLGYAGAKYADRRLDITGKAATAAAAITSQIPLARTILRKPLTRAMAKNKLLDAAQSKEMQEGMEMLSPSQRAIMAGATPSSFLATKGQRLAYGQQMMERAGKKNAQAIKDELMPSYVKQMTMQRQNELKAKGVTGDALKTQMKEEEGMIKNRAAQYAERDVQARQAFMLDKARQSAKKAGNDEMVRSIDDQIKADPQLALDKAEIAKKLISDPDALNKMSDQAKGDVGVLSELLEASGATLKDENGLVMGYDRAKLDAFTDKIKDKKLRENIDLVTKFATESHVKGPDGKQRGLDKKALSELIIGKNEKGKTRMFKMPVREAGKVQGVVGGLESFVAIGPVTGVAGGTGPMLGDVRFATTEAVMSERAMQVQDEYLKNPADIQNIENAFKHISAEDVFKNDTSWDAYSTAEAADLDSIKDWEVKTVYTPVLDAAGQEMKNKKGQTIMQEKTVSSLEQKAVEKALQKFETMTAKISDMSTAQRAKFAADAGKRGIVRFIIQAKKAGFVDATRDKNFKGFMDELVKIETNIKKTGRVATADEQEAMNALTEMRRELLEEDNKAIASAYRKTIEPEELT